MELPYTKTTKTPSYFLNMPSLGEDEELSGDMLPLRCPLDIQVEVLRGELNT